MLSFKWEYIKALPRALVEGTLVGIAAGLIGHRMTENDGVSKTVGFSAGLGWMFARFNHDIQKQQKRKYGHNKCCLTAKNPPWNNQEGMENHEKQLQEGNIQEAMDMREYLTLKKKIAHFAGEVYLVLLDNGVKAVWKPRKAEELDSAFSEVAAFKASQFLAEYTRCHLVPATVMKDYNGRSGSLQWFVESDLDLWIDLDRDRAYAGLKRANLAYGAAFIHVLGQWDTHPGNQIMFFDSNGSTVLALIDNECIVNRKYSRSISERAFTRIAYSDELEMQGNFDKAPASLTLKNPSQQAINEALKPFNLPDKQLKGLYEIITDKGVSDLNYIIWKNSLWVQYHQNNKKAFPNFVPDTPAWVTEVYSQLTMDSLRNIFALGVRAFPEHFNQDFFEDILARRDQLLEVTAKNKHFSHSML